MNNILCIKCNTSKDPTEFDTQLNNKTVHLEICAICFHKEYNKDTPYKMCNRCNKYLPCERFGRSKTGFDAYCRPCKKEYKREYDIKNRQRHYDYVKKNGYAKYKYENYAKNKEYFDGYQKKRYANNKKILEFVKAHPELQETIESGET